MGTERLHIKAASREIERNTKAGTFLTFTQPLEHKNGHVFLLLDIAHTYKQSPAIISLLRESVERLGRSLSDKGHLQHRFEQVLQTINEELAELLEDTASTDGIHIALGVLRDTSFILSATGTLQALFMRKTAKQRFRVFDLSQNLRTEAGSVDDDKLFSVVLDGDLRADDVLLLASQELQSLVAVDEIHPLLTTLPPAGALETVEQYLPVRARLSLVLFQVRQEKSVLTGFGKHTTGKTSMNALLETERQTTNMLDLEKPHIQQSFKRMMTMLRSKNPIERKEALRNVFTTLLHWSKIAGTTLLQLLTRAALSIGSIVQIVVSRGSKREQAVTALKRTWRTGTGTTRAASGASTARAWTRKSLLIGGVLLLIVLIGGVSLVQVRQRAQEREVALNTLFEQVATLQDQAEASQIYEDEDAARSYLQDALTLLAEIENPNEATTERITNTIAAINLQLDDLRHIVPVEVQTTPLVNNVIQSASTTQVFLRDNTTATYTGAAITVAESVDTDITAFTHVTSYADQYLGIDSNGVFAAYAPASNTWSRVGINNVENELTDTIDLTHYGERIYMLTPTQVYRHQRLPNGEYGPGEAWITDSVDLSDTTALAVDGTIWIGANGLVRRFEAGREIGTNLASIDPPLSSVTDLYTTAESPLLYILDANNKRIVAYNKESQEMVAQYTNEQFSGAQSLYVDSVGTVTVFAPTTILQFTVAL